MTLALPKSLVHSLMGQRGHGKTGMRYAKPTLFFSKHLGGRVNGLTLSLVFRHGSGGIDSMLENQMMNFSHAFRCARCLPSGARGTLLTQAIRKLFVLIY
jgi:hypothetical protein